MSRNSLSSRQSDMLVFTTLAAPLAGLAFTAAKSDGAFLRAGKAGMVVGLVGSLGTGLFALANASKQIEELGNTFAGAVFGAAGGAAAGIIGSLVRDSLR